MKSPLLYFMAVLALGSPLQAEIKLSKVFTPHMVLQRGMAVPIWGTAAPGEKVVVKFREQTKETVAGADGKWSVKLDALQPGGPDVLTIGDKAIEDVLVGDVWVGSGQSNMDMPVLSYIKDDAVLAEAAKGTYPKMRLLTKGPNDAWRLATPENNGHMSALLFSFGYALRKEVDVPIGLMVGAVGGTPSGFWLSEAMYREDEACAELVKKLAQTYDYEKLQAAYVAAKTKYDADFAAWKPLADAAKAEGKPIPPGPRAPQPVGKAGEANTGKIGQLFEAYIRPYVGYAIKGVLWDQGESRTNIALVDQVTLMGALIKGWRKEWGQDFPFLYVQKPSGGGCAFDYSRPMNVRADKFAARPATIPAPPADDYSHETFTRIMKYPNTYMVTSSDLGAGIHPAIKSGYGERAVQVAMNVAYGKKSEFLGPLYASSEVNGDKITVKFTHTGSGLAFAHGEKLQGFMIAGEDKKFVWADAEIVGDTVVVSSKEVAKPAAVRYAWSNQFPWANLFNKDGFPAQPFRSDAW